MRKFTIVMAAMMVVLTSSTVFAEQSKTTESKKVTKAESSLVADSHEYGIFRRLDLTTEQKKEMRQLMQSAITSHRESMQEYRDTVHKLITADSFDEAAAHDAISKMDNVRIDEIKMHQKMYSMLTPEQKKAYQDEYQSMQAKMKKHMEKRMMKMEKLRPAE